MNYTPEQLNEIYDLVDIDTIFDHYDIVVTQRSYPELRMRCVYPWHDDYHASASFNVDGYPCGVYNCSVCGGANLFLIIQKLENFESFEKAVEYVARQVGYRLDEEFNEFEYGQRIFERLHLEKKKREREKEEELEEIFLPSSFKPAINYPDILEKRKSLNELMVDKFDICYSEEGYYKGRLIIPVWFEDKIVSFAARDMTGKSDEWTRMLKEAKEGGRSKEEIERLRDKYEYKKIIYPYGSPINRIFFNWDEAIKNPDYVILTEGVFDAMKLCEWGYNAMAIFGIQVNPRKIKMLIDKFKKVYVALDNDEGKKKNWGQLAASKIIENLEDAVESHNILLPNGKDPDDCVKEEFDECLEGTKRPSLSNNVLRR